MGNQDRQHRRWQRGEPSNGTEQSIQLSRKAHADPRHTITGRCSGARAEDAEPRGRRGTREGSRNHGVVDGCEHAARSRSVFVSRPPTRQRSIIYVRLPTTVHHRRTSLDSPIRPAPSVAGRRRISRFPHMVRTRMLRASDRVESAEDLPCRPSQWGIPQLPTGSALQSKRLLRLNTSPARPPVSASLLHSPAATHDSESIIVWTVTIVTPGRFDWRTGGLTDDGE